VANVIIGTDFSFQQWRAASRPIAVDEGFKHSYWVLAKTSRNHVTQIFQIAPLYELSKSPFTNEPAWSSRGNIDLYLKASAIKSSIYGPPSRPWASNNRRFKVARYHKCPCLAIKSATSTTDDSCRSGLITRCKYIVFLVCCYPSLIQLVRPIFFAKINRQKYDRKLPVGKPRKDTLRCRRAKPTKQWRKIIQKRSEGHNARPINRVNRHPTWRLFKERLIGKAGFHHITFGNHQSYFGLAILNNINASIHCGHLTTAVLLDTRWYGCKIKILSVFRLTTNLQ